ncbi:MAG: prepilin-type N-terminal cleavage/methylation domain-containing protein [Candidatus Omnitrophica bacterium]|nr:prepilin-type N-terminal cleavage/methylation domain-containing protein [Candidatus Omnitrophota bacterium]
MISPIGSSKTIAGFTLVEIMLTSAILSLAIVVIFQSLLRSLSIDQYLLKRIAVSCVANNLVWEMKNSPGKAKIFASGLASFLGQESGVSYSWKTNISPVTQEKPPKKNMYHAGLVLTIVNEAKKIDFSRGFYFED